MTAAVRTGIEIAAPVPGLIPEYEEREAARFGLYRWEDWSALPVEERVRGVAHFKMHSLISLHEGEALNQHIEAESKRNAARSGGDGARFMGGRPRG